MSWLIDFFKMWNWVGRLGMIGATIGFLVGFIAAFIVAPIPALVFFAIFSGVFFFVFRSIFGPEIENRQLMLNGLDAEATILEVQETGWTVNNLYYVVNFTVEVRVPGRPSYKAKVSGMVSRLTMPQFQPGAVVPVKVDPRRPQKVALVERTEVGQAAPNSPAPIGQDQVKSLETMLAKRDALNKELLAKGEEAEAIILRAWDMGIMVNGDNPFMGFLVEVHPADKPAFTAEAQAPILKQAVQKYQSGNKIHVRFDPNDQTRVTLEHAL